MASTWIEKRPQGYIVRWRNGGVKHASPAYGSKSEAVEAAAELARRLGPTLRIRKQGPRARQYPSLERLAQSWQVEHGQSNRPGQSQYASTVVATVTRLAGELHWITTQDVNLETLRTWKIAHGNRGARGLSYLRAVLRWASATMDQPLDLRVDRALRAPPSQEADCAPYTSDQVQQVLDLAALLGQAPILSCIDTYGWRPITACRLTCGDLRADGTIKIGIKRNGPWTHPLFPWHIEQLGKLAHGRDASEPLFLSPRGRGWKVTASAAELGCWYRDNVHPAGAPGNIYQLKRHAITRMHKGEPPWLRPLSIAEIQLFTGHRSKAQVLRYIKAHIDEARAVMGQLPTVGACGANGAPADRIAPAAPRLPMAEVLQFPASSG